MQSQQSQQQHRGQSITPWLLCGSVLLLIVVATGHSGCYPQQQHVMPTTAPVSATPHAALSTLLPSVSRMVDLTHTITQDMPVPPARQSPRFTFTTSHTTVKTLSMDLHTGTSAMLWTHDPLLHIDTLSPRDVVLPAVVLDLREHVPAPSAPPMPSPCVVDIAAINTWEATYGTIPAGSMVLLATGWDVWWGSPAIYLFGHNSDQRQTAFMPPAISNDAIRWLATERGVRGIGIDAPLSLLPYEDAYETKNEDTTPTLPHTTLLFVANLTNVEQLPAVGTTLFLGVLKVQGAMVAPVHAIAFIPDG